jgi:hypothetical protein
VGDEGKVLLATRLEYVLGITASEVVSVLDRGDLADGGGHGKVIERHVREPDVPDFSFSLQLGERPDRACVGDCRIGDVDLVEVDTVDL